MALWVVLLLSDSGWLTNNDTSIDGARASLLQIETHMMSWPCYVGSTDSAEVAHVWDNVCVNPDPCFCALVIWLECSTSLPQPHAHLVTSAH